MVLWHDRWFPTGRNESRGWRLDIVSLLAVIGESSVAAHSQEMTASWTCLLPRLIPAPQALLRSFRPRRLDPIAAKVFGVKSGSVADELNFFANIIHDIDNVPTYAFRWYKISYERKEEALETQGRKASIVDKWLPSHKITSTDTELTKIDEENGQFSLDSPMRRRNKVHSWAHLSRKETAPETPAEPKKPAMVPLKFLSPTNAVSFASCALSVGALIWSIVIRDGVALLAVVCISIASSLIGAGLWWRPVLAQRPSNGKVPAGDVLIKTRTAAFIYVECNEQIARELYFGTERCDHYLKSTNLFRACSGFGTLLLMVSVVLLGNCSWVMQAVVGFIYLMLNGMYWATSLLKKKKFWDLRRYKCEEVKLTDPLLVKPAHKPDGDDPPSYTRTLWYVIKATKRTDWIRKTEAVPETQSWDKWLKEAQNAVTEGKEWDPVEAKDKLMREEVERGG